MGFLLLAGCGDDVVDPAELEAQVGAPIYWLGDGFEGFELVRAEGSRRGALFVYGECEAKSDQGCAPPLQLQNVKCPGEPTAVAIFVGQGASGGLMRRAADSLEPVARAAAKPPRVAFGRNPFADC